MFNFYRAWYPFPFMSFLLRSNRITVPFFDWEISHSFSFLPCGFLVASLESALDDDCLFCGLMSSRSRWKVIKFFTGDIDCKILIAVSQFFKKAVSGMFVPDDRSVTWRELIALSGLAIGLRVKCNALWLSCWLASSGSLVNCSPAALMCSGDCVSNWISVHSTVDDW